MDPEGRPFLWLLCLCALIQVILFIVFWPWIRWGRKWREPTMLEQMLEAEPVEPPKVTIEMEVFKKLKIVPRQRDLRDMP